MKSSSLLSTLCIFACGLGVGYALFKGTVGEAPADSPEKLSSTTPRNSTAPETKTPLPESTQHTLKNAVNALNVVGEFSQEEFKLLFSKGDDPFNLGLDRSNPNRTLILRSAAYDWVEKDPETVWKFVKEGKDTYNGYYLGTPVLKYLLKTYDSQSIHAQILQISKEKTRDAMERKFSLFVDVEEIGGYLHYYSNTYADAPNHPRYWANLMRRLFDHSPQQAKAYALQLDDPASQNRALRYVISSRLAHADPLAAISMSQSLPDAKQRYETLRATMMTWMRHDPTAAVDYISNMPNDTSSLKLIKSLGHYLARENPEEAIRLAYSLDSPSFRESLIPTAIGEIAREDFVRAQRMIDEMPHGNVRNSASYGLIQQMSPQDVEPTLHWLRENNFGNRLDSMLRSAGRKIAKMDREIVDHYLSRDIDPTLRQSIVQSIATSYGDSDPAEGLKWVSSLNEKDAEHATSSLLEKWSQNDSQAVLNYLSSSRDSLKSLKSRSLASHLSANIPEELAHWLTGRPKDSPPHPQVYGALISKWIEHDPWKASQWVDDLPAGENRDGAITSIVDYLSYSDPEAGFYWALSIQNESLRSRNLNRAIHSLQQQNPEKVGQLINSPDLTEKERERLERSISRSLDR